MVGSEIDAAVKRRSRGAFDEALVPRVAAGEPCASAGHFDEPSVPDKSVAARAADVDIKAAQRGVRSIMGGEAQFKSRRHDNLSVARCEGAGIEHIGCGEQDVTAIAVGAGCAFQERAGLHRDVASAVAGQEGIGRREGRGAAGACGHGQGREEKLGIRIVEETALHEVVVERQRGSREAPRVDLTASAEDDAVLIDDEHLSRRGNATEDLRGPPRVIDHAVEGDPLRHVGTGRALVEMQMGAATEVEGVPFNQRLLRRLLHRHLCPIIRAPFHGGSGSNRDTAQLKAADREAIGHRRKQLPRVIWIRSGRARAADRGGPCLCLHVPDGFKRAGGAGEGILTPGESGLLRGNRAPGRGIGGP